MCSGVTITTTVTVPPGQESGSLPYLLTVITVRLTQLMVRGPIVRVRRHPHPTCPDNSPGNYHIHPQSPIPTSFSQGSGDPSRRYLMVVTTTIHPTRTVVQGTTTRTRPSPSGPTDYRPGDLSHGTTVVTTVTHPIRRGVRGPTIRVHGHHRSPTWTVDRGPTTSPPGQGSGGLPHTSTFRRDDDLRGPNDRHKQSQEISLSWLSYIGIAIDVIK